MATPWAKLFIDPNDLLGCATLTNATSNKTFVSCDSFGSTADSVWGMLQTLSLMLAYMYILFTASNMLSDGSELLLLVPSLAGLVGSVVLPILGAVPDGAIMLFSGLGDRAEAQESLAVGVGALAGSTIMLLTVPWGMSIIAGRVGLGPDGRARYGVRQSLITGSSRDGVIKAKLKHSASSVLCGTGVTPTGTIKSNALLMVGTSLTYLVIQGPAFKYSSDAPGDDAAKLDLDWKIADTERWWAFVGLILSIALFAFYLWLMVKQSGEEDQGEVQEMKRERKIVQEL